MLGHSRPVRGGSSYRVASRRLGVLEVDRTTRKRSSASEGHRPQVPPPERSRARPPENPRSAGGRSAADREVERFLGPTVEKVTRIVIASRAGLSAETPWLEIFGALERLEGRHGFDPELVATLRWIAQPHSDSSTRATGPRPSSKPEDRSTR